jgi:rfaE bifunctional protein kinase chain/domain
MKLHPESIKTLSEIKIKARNSKRIVFVSGNFNIVHPGHLRLLRFAKECGDFLIVGLYDKKSAGAIIPEELRLESIRSLSLVNYAFVLRDKTEEFIRRLKPSFVVKGAEHQNKNNPEQHVVETYGGKLLFGSGDTTFSSLDLIKSEIYQFNKSTIVKPQDFLQRHNFSLTDLQTILSNIKNLKVIVIGDLIVDEYITCDPLGMSQEDPTIVVTPLMTEKFIGGGGIVASHARSLGAEVHYITVSGNDSTAEFAKEKINNYGVNACFFNDESRPTTLKQRFRASGKTLLRVSHLRQLDINKEIVNKIFKKITSMISGTDLVIFADFNYGCLPQELVDDIVKICVQKKIMMVADSQSSSQVGDVSRFHYMSLLTPTEREARLAVRDFNSGLIILAESLRKKAKARNVIITLGQEGLLIQADHLKNNQLFTDNLPAMNTSPKDIAGAGDSFFVCCSLAMALKFNIWQSSYFGSIAAACQVGRIGNLPLTAKDLEIELTNGV